MRRLRIERSFKVVTWDEACKQKAVDFWTRRRIVFGNTSERTLHGQRGSWFGNLTSFDMSKLITALTVSVSPENEVHCVLEVNTILQVITDWNRLWWDLEMETFECFLLRGDELEERWKKYRQGSKKAAWKWSFSGGARGDKVPPDERP